ncbi:polysaccharide biosynthesis protein [Brevibacterium sp. UMB1308A]|uniref:polysaccharide biosynthesis protein n=1 Tax=Brevibacterium sp. UMB1308A TaxID=3050608 RepID=UPI0025514F96|nr:polysaccharide biosynthesis protein [Brevibacterium sp. UMB1308A]MDK8346575.1 polysaccharide biosynthesis protein [Brevibacterium sp. UMB1308B]MDK8713484.1 polysaccharide biosynthesis protein [Brevibacterium sp. UMB1308A]
MSKDQAIASPSQPEPTGTNFPARSLRTTKQAIVRALRDGFVYAVAVWVAAMVRYDFSVTSPNYTHILIVATCGFIFFVLIGPLTVYRGRFWKASGDELMAIGSLTAIVTGLLYLAFLLPWFQREIPLSVPLTAGALTIVAIGTLSWLDTAWTQRRRIQNSRAKKALIIGAGVHGRTAYRMIAEDPREEFVAVGFLDDDRAKRHLRIEGVRVLGPLTALSELLDDIKPDLVVLASNSLPSDKVDSIVKETSAREVDLRVLPHLRAEDQRRQTMNQISPVVSRPGFFRSIEFDDLVGRQPINTNVDEIADYLTGKTVLVTGAGGSIGSVLCKQLVKYAPKRVVMTDRDESGLHSTQLILEGSALLTSDDLILGDLRDGHFVRSMVADVKPDIIFHAAALKHLTFLERFPDEAVKTNVGASMSLLDAAIENDVENFVHISTDKAADPSSVLGASKYLTERAVAEVARQTGRRYMSVRFGNVLGSRGSVLGTFVAQVQAGGPVTVTAPGVKRYFMAATEACDLVLQAGALGNPGETLVLDMGEPVLIEDLAKRVIALSGRDDIEIVYTGLRDGEKAEEVRLAAGELDDRPGHPLISQVPISQISLEHVRSIVAAGRLAGHRRDAELRAQLLSLIHQSECMSDTQTNVLNPSQPSTSPLPLGELIAKQSEGE